MFFYESSNFGAYLLVMLVFMGTAVVLHEIGHILFARYHNLEYNILFVKGNIIISADWERLGKMKIYGNLLGILLGLPPVILAGWLFHTPVFLLLYLLSCYDDFSDVVAEIANYKKIF